MNKVILMGRLTRDPDVRYTNGPEPMAIGRYTIAVDRISRANGEQSADFINCVVFGKAAEFAEKYYTKGIKILVTGRIQTGSFTNKDGQKVYTTEVAIESQEFCESKNDDGFNKINAPVETEEFTNIPDGIDEDLPFAQPTR